jgi:hypothetical protein
MSKELRQRIALAMLAQKKRPPQNLGEGLSAIGDSLGEIGTMRRLAAEENEAFTGGNKRADELLGVTPPGTGLPPQTPPGPPPVAAAAQSAPSALYTPDADPRDPTPVPGNVQEGGPAQGMLLRPNIRIAARSMSPAPAPAPGSPPPTGAPGDTGATTFQPPFQPPPAPLPTDQQQTYEPGAATRMPAQPGRPTVADYGQPPILAKTTPTTPPVMAQGEAPSFDAPISQYDQQSDPRREATLALLRQRMGGGAPAPAASPPPMPPTPQADASQGIRPAPPAAPPVTRAPPPQPPAPPPAGPQPGYVSQPPKAVIAPMPEPMSRHEAELREAIARDPDGMNGQLARRIGPVIKTLEDNRAAINQRNIEKYKIDIAAEAAMLQKIEDQKAGAAKDVAGVAHTQAQTRKEGVIEDVDSKMIIGPDGIARPIQVDSGTGSAREPPLPKNEAQLKALKHHEQMADAEKIIGDGKALRGIQSATGARVPVVGAYLQSDAYRKERAAAERWVINKLRPESGAQFSDAEIDREVKAYFPQPSDDAKTVADKNAARRIANEGMLESSGREGKKYMEWKNSKAAEADAAKQAEINDAKKWLNDNPNDPRVEKVKKWLQGKGA